MSNYKNRSRSLARDKYWEENDRDSYTCPDCGRTEDQIIGAFEVHHKNGEPLDNRPENHVALCRTCHMLREGKKPSIERIDNLRNISIANEPPKTQKEISLEVVEYVYNTIGENPKNEGWVNVLDVYSGKFFERYEIDFGKFEFIQQLKRLTDCSVEIIDDRVDVIGIHLYSGKGTLSRNSEECNHENLSYAVSRTGDKRKYCTNCKYIFK